MAPILAPELKRPVANARSLRGNHSATVLMAAGKLPASVTPNAARATEKPNTLLAAACKTAATLQSPVAHAYPFLVPTVSINRPANNNPMA